MAERKSQNKYYPPEWEPKDGSINKFVGQHPLRERARKLDQGILIVRFEMPYNVYCESCKNHIAKGARFNAEKKAVGNYFTTKIWSFKMKCHHCQVQIEVQTDPQNRDYALTKGIHRVKAEDWNPEDTNTIKLMGEGEQNAIRIDPFKKLEHLQEDLEFADDEKVQLLDLQELRDRLAADDYDKNYALRKTFRDKKKEIETRTKESADRGLSITLLPNSTEDVEQAQQTKFATRSLSYNQQRATERLRIKSSSIFGDKSKKEVVKRLAVQKCIKNGIDPRLFLRGKSENGEATLVSPARVDLKHNFVREKTASV